MPRVKIGPALPDRKAIEVEIAALRDLDLALCFGSADTPPFAAGRPPQLPRHLLYRTLAYRLQGDHFGGLDAETERLLDRSASQAKAVQRTAAPAIASLRPGTVLGREWKGRMHRVAVMADGFAWNGISYPSLSKMAFAITGTRWNGPKFFGLRDKIGNGASS
jgi:hypothetical protein